MEVIIAAAFAAMNPIRNQIIMDHGMRTLHNDITQTVKSHEPLPFWTSQIAKKTVADIMEHDIIQTAISNKPLMSQTETSHELILFWTTNMPKLPKIQFPMLKIAT